MNFDSLSKYLEKIHIVYDIPCMDCIVWQNHRQIFRKQLGWRDVERQCPVSSRDAYWLYSATKVCTAAAAMQLQQQGLLAVDASVSDYLPEFASLSVMKDGRTEELAQPLRVRDLMSMQGGFDYSVTPALKSFAASFPQASTREVIREFAKRPLLFEPGTHFQYSWCLDILGAVMEVASGKPLGQLLQEAIFRPLAMDATTFRPDAAEMSRLSAQYRMLDNPYRIVPEGSGNFCRLTQNFESAGGGLYSTAEDYIRLADCLACGGIGFNGVRILSTESVRRLGTNLLSDECLADFHARYQRPGYGYGYGIHVCMSDNNPEPRGTFGWDGAAGAHILIDPENAVSLVYLQHVLDMEFLYDNVFVQMDRLLYEGL